MEIIRWPGTFDSGFCCSCAGVGRGRVVECFGIRVGSPIFSRLFCLPWRHTSHMICGKGLHPGDLSITYIWSTPRYSMNVPAPSESPRDSRAEKEKRNVEDDKTKEMTAAGLEPAILCETEHQIDACKADALTTGPRSLARLVTSRLHKIPRAISAGPGTSDWPCRSRAILDGWMGPRPAVSSRNKK